MFYDVLVDLCEKTGTKPTPLLKQLHLSPGNLQRWKNGASVNSDILEALSEHFKVSIDYLLTGKEKSSPTDKLSADERDLLTYYNVLPIKEQGKLLGRAEALAEQFRATEIEKPKIKYIEYYSLPVSAGTGIYLDGDDREMLEVPETPLTAEANFALEVRGDSMEPKFYDGDTILIRTQPNVEEGEIGVFILNDEGYVKKFGGDRLISLNEKYDDILLSEYDNLQCKGKVIGKL